MNKLILVFVVLLVLVLFGCTQSGPVCGDLVCGMDELSSESSYYCPSDCGIDDSNFMSLGWERGVPESIDANFFTVKENYEVGEQINIQ